MDFGSKDLFENEPVLHTIFHYSDTPCFIVNASLDFITSNASFSVQIEGRNIKTFDNFLKTYLSNNSFEGIFNALKFITNNKVTSLSLDLDFNFAEKIIRSNFAIYPLKISDKQQPLFLLLAKNGFLDIDTHILDSEKHLKLLFENMDDAFALHQVIYNELGVPIDFIYIDANSAFQKLVGKSRHEIIGKRVADILPTYNDAWLKTLGGVALHMERYDQVHFIDFFNRYFRVKAYTHKEGTFSILLTDVTPQIEAEKALAESEERFRMIAENTADFISLHNKEGDYIYASPVIESITGYSPNEIVGTSAYRYFHPDEIEYIKGFHQQLIDTGSAPPMAYRFLHKNGFYIWLESAMQSKTNEQGQYIAFASSRNITDRIEAEQKLKLSEEKYRFLTENILDVIWILDLETMRFTYISPSVQKLRGYTAEEALNLSFSQTLTPQSQVKVNLVVKAEVESFIKTASSQIYIDEVEQFCKNGTTVWTEIVATIRVNTINGRLEAIGTARDITARFNAEKSRRELEERYRNLTEVTMEGILIHRNGVMVDVNPSMLNMLGLENDRRAIIGKKVYDFLHLEDINIVRKKIASNYNGRYEVRIKRMDGSWFTSELLVRNIDIDGLPHRVVSVLDITERKLAEQKIRESELKFRRIFDNSISGIIFTDTKGQILLANTAFEALLGYGEGKLIGKSIFNLIIGDDTIDDRMRLLDAMRTGVERLRFERRLQNITRQEVWCDISLAIMRDIDGHPLSMVVVVNDITEKKKYENELLKALSFNKTINQTSPVGIISTDNEGFIVFANKRAQDILNLSKQQLIGSRIFDNGWQILNINGENLPVEQLPFNQFANGDNDDMITGLRIRVIHPDGKEMALSLNAKKAFDQFNHFSGLVISIEDIGDKLKMEQELQHSNDKLIELNSAKDKFFSIIAHDLRGPIGNIANISELLSASFVENNADFNFNQQLIKSIYDSSVKTFDLLENLLAWSFSQRNIVSVNISPLAVHSLVYNALMVIEGLSKKKNIKINLDIDKNINVLGDKDMLETVIRNLASNALKYSPKNSDVDITAVRSVNFLGYIEISVVDKGIGMSKEVLERLFTTHLQVSVAGTMGEEGTGLGLVLCREFIEKQNGKIWAASAPGQGSKFTFILPEAL